MGRRFPGILFLTLRVKRTVFLNKWKLSNLTRRACEIIDGR